MPVSVSLSSRKRQLPPSVGTSGKAGLNAYRKHRETASLPSLILAHRRRQSGEGDRRVAADGRIDRSAAPLNGTVTRSRLEA